MWTHSRQREQHSLFGSNCTAPLEWTCINPVDIKSTGNYERIADGKQSDIVQGWVVELTTY